MEYSKILFACPVCLFYYLLLGSFFSLTPHFAENAHSVAMSPDFFKPVVQEVNLWLSYLFWPNNSFSGWMYIPGDRIILSPWLGDYIWKCILKGMSMMLVSGCSQRTTENIPLDSDSQTLYQSIHRVVAA